MNKIGILLVLGMLSACASFGKGVGEAFIDSNKVKLDRCEIEGFEYKGIKEQFDNKKVLKVMMIHGVGLHHPGYSRRIQENLANNMGLDVLSRVSKNVSLLDPNNKKTPLGNLRVTFWQNKDASENMLFYELTWSEITTPEKKIIAFDTTEEYSKFRVPFNNVMKEFLDNALPDPMIYLTDRNGLILDSSKQAICWMLKTNWEDIPNGQAAVCNLAPYEALEKVNSEDLLFVTHSLGSKILMDAITNITVEASTLQRKDNNPAYQQQMAMLREKEITVFMLANQLPILQIGHPLPRVNNQIDAYCTPSGKKYNQRVFKAVNIVAFSDPNDILSYAIPQDFADEYIDSRICPQVTNVSVNVAPEISAFGVGVVNPISAHTAYDNSPKVINLISKGTYQFDKNDYLRQKCHFIEMKRDKQM